MLYLRVKIQYASDLHLEFKDNKQWLEDHPLLPVGDILLLAGDIYHLGPHYFKHPFFAKLSKQFKQVYIIPGNHEYYEGYDLAETITPTKRAIHHNVFLVNNIALDLGEVELICSTLWSRIEQYPIEVRYGMMDFKHILYHRRIISVQDYNECFEECWGFLRPLLEKPAEKPRIVMTHHLPSAACNAEEFVGSKLNEGFCTDLTRHIEASQVDYWIYGHSHRNLPDFTIGNTQMLTNQLGYVRWRESKTFNTGLIIEV